MLKCQNTCKYAGLLKCWYHELLKCAKMSWNAEILMSWKCAEMVTEDVMDVYISLGSSNKRQNGNFPSQMEDKMATNPCVLLTARCYLPKSVGRCRATQTRHYYNPETRQCEQFVYGGCLGNTNNFESMEECETSCVQPQKQGQYVPLQKRVSRYQAMCIVFGLTTPTDSWIHLKPICLTP